MELKTIKYQDDAVAKMLEYSIQVITSSFTCSNRSLISLIANSPPTILLEATTGSGKTVIMSKFLNELFNADEDNINDINTAVIWLSVGQGGLTEQSHKRIEEFSDKLNCIGPDEIISGSITELSNKDVLFLSWDKLNVQDKNGEWQNILMRDGEGMNFPKLLENTHLTKTKIILVIDESHIGSNSERSKAIKALISPELVINVTATPSKKLVEEIENLSNINDSLTGMPLGLHVRISTTEVIDAGMIKRDLVINKDIASALKKTKEGTSPIPIVLKEAVRMRDELEKMFNSAYQTGQSKKKINPLLLVQISDADKGEETKSEIIECLKKEGIEFPNDDDPNGTLACWFSTNTEQDNQDSGKKTNPSKINLEGIEKLDAPQKVLLFKTAIATGWDCPRAYILVKFRESASGTPFSRQVVGRILRMPEQHHYAGSTNEKGVITGWDILNKAYIYTNEETFTFEMDNTYDTSNDALSKVNIYKSSVCMQDKYTGMMEFSTQLPLPTYTTMDTVKVFSDKTFTETFTRVFPSKFKSMVKFAEEHQELLNINLLLDTTYSVDQLQNADKAVNLKGKLVLQSNITRLKVYSILGKCAKNKDRLELLKKLLNSYRIFLMNHGDPEVDEVDPKTGKSVWFSQPGDRKMLSVLYINQFNPELSQGTLGSEGLSKKDSDNHLVNFFNSMFLSCFEVPNHDISKNNVGSIKIPTEALLEIVDAEEEYDEYENNCLYGIMPSIKYRPLREYVECHILDNPKVKWWYPNWVLTKGLYQVRLPYIDEEGLLKTVKPDLIVDKIINNGDVRVYTFLVSSEEQEMIVNTAINNFKSICNDVSIDYEVIKSYSSDKDEDIEEEREDIFTDDDFNDVSDISALNFSIPE